MHHYTTFKFSIPFAISSVTATAISTNLQSVLSRDMEAATSISRKKDQK